MGPINLQALLKVQVFKSVHTTTHQVLIQNSNQNWIKLDTIYHKTHSQLNMRTIINQWNQTFYNVSNSYKLFLTLFLPEHKVKCHSFYITELHKIRVCVLSEIPSQVQTPNEYQFYLIKPGTANDILNQVRLFLRNSNSVFQTQKSWTNPALSWDFLKYISNHLCPSLFKDASDVVSVLSKPKVAQGGLRLFM